MEHHKSCILSDLLFLVCFRFHVFSDLAILFCAHRSKGSSNSLFARWPGKRYEQSQRLNFVHRTGSGRSKPDPQLEWDYVVHRAHPDLEKAWHDISSHETTVAIVLGQVGGYCEPRLNLTVRPSDLALTVGHTTLCPRA